MPCFRGWSFALLFVKSCLHHASHSEQARLSKSKGQWIRTAADSVLSTNCNCWDGQTSIATRGCGLLLPEVSYKQSDCSCWGDISLHFSVSNYIYICSLLTPTDYIHFLWGKETHSSVFWHNGTLSKLLKCYYYGVIMVMTVNCYQSWVCVKVLVSVPLTQ